MNQAELIERPITADVFTLLRMFENHRGIDVPQDWYDLLQRYHGAFDDPASRSSWNPSRLRNVLDEADESGLIVYREKWEITAAGLETRKAETVRRMRG